MILITIIIMIIIIIILTMIILILIIMIIIIIIMIIMIIIILLLIIMNKFSIALFPVKTSSTRLITNVQQMSENGSMLPHYSRTFFLTCTCHKGQTYPNLCSFWHSHTYVTVTHACWNVFSHKCIQDTRKLYYLKR